MSGCMSECVGDSASPQVICNTLADAVCCYGRPYMLSLVSPRPFLGQPRLSPPAPALRGRSQRRCPC